MVVCIIMSKCVFVYMCGGGGGDVCRETMYSTYNDICKYMGVCICDSTPRERERESVGRVGGGG